ncbi:MAG: AMMECR1 family protein [bacterium]|nr:AMMECR1 family protein [bacterium]
MTSKFNPLKICLSVIFYANFLIPFSLSDTAISVCRKAIKHYLLTGEKIRLSNLPEIFSEKIPVYVSLRKGNQTRGCAGTFYADKSFGENLVDFSIIAATRDFRYRAIDKKELETVKIQLTIPSEIIEISSIAFYNPEKEGLVVEKQGRYGVILPCEARTAEYALKMCMRNAGIKDYNGIRLLKFNAQIFIEGEK